MNFPSFLTILFEFIIPPFLHSVKAKENPELFGGQTWIKKDELTASP
jgi:hypothetical protein